MPRSEVLTQPAIGLVPLLAYAEERGVDTSALMQRVGLDPAILEDREARISFGVDRALWVALVEQTADPWFGVHYAQAIDERGLGLFDYLWHASSTLGQAIDGVVRYARLWNSAFRHELVIEGDRARLIRTCLAREQHVAAHEHYFTTIGALRTHSLLGRQVWPLQLSFAQPRPADTRQLDRALPVPKRWDAPHAESVFDRALLDVPSATANPELHAILEARARGLTARLPAVADDFIEQCHRAYEAAITAGDTRVEHVARVLAMHPRTLQRRLEADGLTHRKMLSETRKRLALRYIDDPSMSIDEIGYALGFASTSSFSRAFKRWTGKSPGQMRRD